MIAFVHGNTEATGAGRALTAAHQFQMVDDGNTCYCANVHSNNFSHLCLFLAKYENLPDDVAYLSVFKDHPTRPRVVVQTAICAHMKDYQEAELRGIHKAYLLDSYR